MKTRTIIFISELLALTSCGSAARYASDASRQRYQDGIYYTSKADTRAADVTAAGNEAETDALVAKTKDSPIFMKSGEKVEGSLLGCFRSRSKSCLVEVNELYKSHISSVTLTETSFQNASISARTLSNLWSDCTEKLSYSLFILEVAEYDTA